jgi:hypothetical protein
VFVVLGAMIPLAGGQAVGTVPGTQTPQFDGVEPDAGVNPHANAVKRTFPDLSKRLISPSISAKVSILIKSV